MRRLAAVLIAVAALWPAVIASAATADITPGNPATPTPTIEPFPTDTLAPSPEPAPSPTPIPLTVIGANGVVLLGGVYQTGSDHYTITAKAPTDLPGTWDLIDNYYGASDLGGGHADHGIDGFSWDWSPSEGAHELVATFHPDCATAPSCPPDFTATGAYNVFEAIATPTPSPASDDPRHKPSGSRQKPEPAVSC